MKPEKRFRADSDADRANLDAWIAHYAVMSARAQFSPPGGWLASPTMTDMLAMAQFRAQITDTATDATTEREAVA